MKKFLLVIAILFSGITSSYASHLMGAEITYIYMGGNDYEVTLVVYRDCSGINLPTTNFNVNFQSASCGQNFNTPLPFLQTVDVSQVCPGQSTTCTGGTIPGTQQFTYRGIVTLTPCADWIMSWTSGTRNPATTNLVNPGGVNLYIQNTLNNIIGANNNSPQFFNIPTPYVCVNQLSIYSHAASDVDGDSLYYSFSNPLTTPGPPGVSIPFMPGYTLLDPMITTAGMNLNQTTGEMCFTPSVAQISVVSVVIEEFRNGLLIGTQIREMQVIVDISCTNQNPTTGAFATCGGSGGMTITVAGPSVDSLDQNSIAMCPNDNVCLQITFSDPDIGDNITVLDNIAAAIPGATWTVTNNNTPNPVGLFCWTPTALDSGINVFSLILQDDACPISGTQTFTYDITVFDEPFAGPDQIICGTQTAQLNASGGATYTWFDAATNIQVPAPTPAFSCNPCANPIAMPSVTTNYYVLSSLTAACENTDSVIIEVVPDFVPDAIGDTTLCDFLSHQLDVNIISGPAGVYTYLWNNATTLSDSSLQNPIASPLDSTWYVVEVTSPDGCTKQVDSVLIGVVIPANVQLSPGDSTICVGEVLNFNVNSSCDYTLEMFDTFGDGWNGQSLDIFENGVLIGNYGLIGPCCTTNFQSITFPVTNGNNIIVIYNTGGFQNESSFNIIDGTGTTVSTFAVGSMTGLTTGDTLYTGIANCGPSITAYTYSWSPGTDLSSTVIPNPVYTSTSTSIGTTTYTVTITDPASGCEFDRSQDITVVLNTLGLPVLSDTSFCEGSSVNIDGGAGYVTYEWVPAPIFSGGNNQIGTINQPGDYAVIVSDGVCVDSSNVITVTEIPLPIPTILGDITFCADDLSTLLSVSPDPIYDTYLWSTGSTFDSTAAGAGTITLTVVDTFGCVSLPINVSVTSLPSPFTTITGIDSICPGATTTLTATGGPFDTYLWSPTNSSITTTTTGPGAVSVTITQNGCDYTANSTVYNYTNPIANFTINPEVSGEPNIDIVFTDASTNASSWVWDFDVTSIGTIPLNETGVGPFTIVYEKQGRYTVTLSVTDDNGCTNAIIKEYLIFSEIGTPNVITPNGDGMNDNLVFESLDASLFPNHITVLNRWGGKVYEQDNYNNDWDGDNLSQGTYFYVLTVDFNTGAEIYKGTLTILR